MCLILIIQIDNRLHSVRKYVNLRLRIFLQVKEVIYIYIYIYIIGSRIPRWMQGESTIRVFSWILSRSKEHYLGSCSTPGRKCLHLKKNGQQLRYCIWIKNVSTYVAVCKRIYAHLRHHGVHVNVYLQTIDIRRTIVGNEITDQLDEVGASPVGAPTTSSFVT